MLVIGSRDINIRETEAESMSVVALFCVDPMPVCSGRDAVVFVVVS